MTIGIFPASGGLGTSTYTHLLKLVPNDQVVLISRYPEKVPKSYIDAGIKTRQASYENTPAELEAAFAGIDTLFLISYPSHVHDYRTKVQLPAVDAARRAGVTHIFYSSLGFAGNYGTTSLAEVMQAHLDTERHLAQLAASSSSFTSDQPFTYTSIREGLYAESTPIYTAFFDPRDGDKNAQVSEICIPHDGTAPGIAWVKRDELGEATAGLIASHAADPTNFAYLNKIVLLTGPRAWSLAETAAVLGSIAGREVRIRKVSVDEYVQQPQVLAKFGRAELARTWATAWDAIRAGETAVVTGELGRILGRESEGFEVAVREHFE